MELAGQTEIVTGSSSGLGAATPGDVRVTRSLPFDYAVSVASLWFVGGLLVDGWAHNNLDLRAEGFFTPYHALFYSGFGAVAAVVGFGTWRNRNGATTLRAAIPSGYATTLAGLGIFAVGGVLDMLWHIVFGVEQDLEALFSPTHLMLAIGIGSILSGPIRAGATRTAARGWRELLPALAALALFATLVLFFFVWAYGLAAGRNGAPQTVYPSLRGDVLQQFAQFQLGHGITAIVVRSLVFVGIALWAARRFALPVGAFSFLFVVPNVLVGAMVAPSAAFLAVQFGAALAAGIVSDIARDRFALLRRGPWGTRAFGFAIPAVFWATFLVLASRLGGGFWWTVHVVYGAPVIGGLVGLLLAISMESGSLPERGSA